MTGEGHMYPPTLPCPVGKTALPQQSEKSWVLEAVSSAGPGRLKPRSLVISGQAGASCLSSRTVWLGSAVLYRKPAMDEEEDEEEEEVVAVGVRSCVVPLGV